MNKSESYIYSMLQENPIQGEWEFFEVRSKDGKSRPQSKRYPSLGFWVAYPDFECRENNNLVLLIEVKGYDGFFDDIDNCLAIKLRNLNSYVNVRNQEEVDVRLCFVVYFPNETRVYWESIENVIEFPCYVKEHKYKEKDFDTGMIIEKEEKFVYWDANLFRTDAKNLAKV